MNKHDVVVIHSYSDSFCREVHRSRHMEISHVWISAAIDSSLSFRQNLSQVEGHQKSIDAFMSNMFSCVLVKCICGVVISNFMN